MGLLDEIQKKAAAAAESKRGRMSQEEKMKKYFVALLGKNETKATRRIRILPAVGTEDVFQVGYFHKVNIKGYGRAKLYDPGRNDGAPSPLNDVAKRLRSLSPEQLKEASFTKEEANKAAREYDPSKFYIVRVIDRDNEADGVKFWRFAHSSKGDGVFDQLVAVIESRGEINDPDQGRDLTITLGLQTNGAMSWTGVVGIIPEDKSPLHENPEVAKAWIEDPITWRDVYSAKPIEYLQIVANGETPKWSSELGKFVPHSEMNSNGSSTFGGSTTTEQEFVPRFDSDVKNTSTHQASSVVTDDEPDEDLPF